LSRNKDTLVVVVAVMLIIQASKLICSSVHYIFFAVMIRYLGSELVQ